MDVRGLMLAAMGYGTYSVMPLCVFDAAREGSNRTHATAAAAHPQEHSADGSSGARAAGAGTEASAGSPSSACAPTRHISYADAVRRTQAAATGARRDGTRHANSGTPVPATPVAPAAAAPRKAATSNTHQRLTLQQHIERLWSRDPQLVVLSVRTLAQVATQGQSAARCRVLCGAATRASCASVRNCATRNCKCDRSDSSVWRSPCVATLLTHAGLLLCVLSRPCVPDSGWTEHVARKWCVAAALCASNDKRPPSRQDACHSSTYQRQREQCVPVPPCLEPHRLGWMLSYLAPTRVHALAALQVRTRKRC